MDDIVVVTAVGAGMRGTPGVAARLFVALASQSINAIAIAQGSSECSISIAVSADQATEAVRQIHREVINGSATGKGCERCRIKKIPVAVLGATGAVGQRFVQLLSRHPWFEVTVLAASERSAGKPYKDVARWVIPGDPPEGVGDMIVRPLTPDLPAKLVFSALPSDVAVRY